MKDGGTSTAGGGHLGFLGEMGVLLANSRVREGQSGGMPEDFRAVPARDEGERSQRRGRVVHANSGEHTRIKGTTHQGTRGQVLRAKGSCLGSLAMMSTPTLQSTANLLCGLSAVELGR